MAGLQLKVGGVWVSSLAAWGDLTWSTCLQGSEELSWAMGYTLPRVGIRRKHQPRLRHRPTVLLYDGTRPIWGGILGEPDDQTGTYTATGLYQEAYKYLALGPGGNRNSNPDVAIDAAIARGLPWTRPASIHNDFMTSDNLDAEPSVGDLLDFYATRENKRWAVTPLGEVYVYTPPAAAAWHVTPGVSLGNGDDHYASSLSGIRRDYVTVTKDGGGTERVAKKAAVPPVTDADAAARWGVRELRVNLTKLGYLTEAEAQTVLTAMLARGIARPGFTGTLTLNAHQLLTAGGIPAHLPAVKAGQRVMLHGLWDDTQELNGRTYLKVLLGRTRHTAAGQTVDLEPAALNARNFTSIFQNLGAGIPRPVQVTRD